MKFPKAMVDEMVAHSREDAPNECCGIVAADDRVATRLFRTTNVEASPFRFVIDSMELYRVNEEAERSGWEIGAIYHSHTRSSAYPSQTDVNFAASWPGVVWVIVSLEHPDTPDVRAFEIDGAEITEVSLEVT